MADIPNLSISDMALEVSELLLLKQAVPINNAETKLAIIRHVESCGLICPLLCSPEELGGTVND